MSHPAAQCTLHHTCERGRRLSQHERESGLLRLGLPPSRDPTPPVMDNILQEVTAIRHFLEKRDRCREVAKEWLQVGYVLDVLLFRVYLVAMVTYSITLGTLWSVWQVAWWTHQWIEIRIKEAKGPGSILCAAQWERGGTRILMEQGWFL